VQGRQDVLSRPGERAYSVHARLTLPTGFGWPVLFAAGLGLAKAARDRDRRELVVLAFAVPWAMSIANAGWVFPRYVTPLVPPVALWAARGVCWLGASVPLRAVLATLILCAPGLLLSVELGRVLSRPDTRLLAARWIDERLSGRARVLSCRPFAELVFERRRARGVSCADGASGLEWADVIVLPSHPDLAHFVPVSPQLRQGVEARGERLARFDPFRPEGVEGAAAEFYPGDAFFVPFRGLTAVERGGPVLEVWSLRRDDPTLWRLHPKTP
jgi:hypothetical protein